MPHSEGLKFPVLLYLASESRFSAAGPAAFPVIFPPFALYFILGSFRSRSFVASHFKYINILTFRKKVRAVAGAEFNFELCADCANHTLSNAISLQLVSCALRKMYSNEEFDEDPNSQHTMLLYVRNE